MRKVIAVSALMLAMSTTAMAAGMGSTTMGTGTVGTGTMGSNSNLGLTTMSWVATATWA